MNTSSKGIRVKREVRRWFNVYVDGGSVYFDSLNLYNEKRDALIAGVHTKHYLSTEFYTVTI